MGGLIIRKAVFPMTILKNGTLVTPNGLFRGDLAMEDGKIARIAAHIPAGSGDTAVASCFPALLTDTPIWI